MDKYGIDGHKLHYHVQRVAEWLSGIDIAPIYMELSPAGACNHRCLFCGLDFMNYSPHFLDTEILKQRLTEFAELGLKSIMFAGEGEPLLHSDITAISRHAHSQGLDLSFTSNGVLLDRDKSQELLPLCSWIKISCNGGTRETYSAIHRCRPHDFDTVMENLSEAVRIKQQNNYSCVIGLQILLLPENREEIFQLVEKCKAIGLDYVVIKPYSHHLLSKTTRYKNIKYKELTIDQERLDEYQTSDFSVIYRKNTMDNWDRGSHGYERCLALPFWTYLDARGNIYGCSMYLNEDRFCYGNINTQAIAEIWHGAKRAESLAWTAKNLDPAVCRVNCRMDKINKYLWSITHPPEHVNFI